MESKDIYADISSIRNLMERSTKFISLSGLSGVLAGIYALAGAGVAYNLLYVNDITDDSIVKIDLFLVALIVLVLSIGTGIVLTIRKARRQHQSIWSVSSKALLKSGLVPLLTGGCFVLILFSQGYYGIIAPGCLIFYGLALIAASKYTFGDVKWLGMCEVVLGLLATINPGYGLAFWAVGFGLLHIVYGAMMHFKYDRENTAQ